jgi:type I restriction enzyme M protein
MPTVNKDKEVGNGNYLWISYFYAYLNEKGRAGFVMASSATDSQGKDKDIREQLIKTGDVDVMISVSNNFFYTKSLPCSLWFFDKAKNDDIKDKILFIDARNYYTVVDRTLNEWSEWQLKNINAIVWLYRGETDKYVDLLNEYKSALGSDKPFADQVHELSEKAKAFRTEAKKAVEAADKRDKKKTQAEYNERLDEITEVLTIAKEAHWLYEKFGDGVYADVLGLCKVADLSEIEEKSWSLTPGAYVGVAPVEDDGVDFDERMAEIHRELLSLQAESNDLMDAISQNMKEMGL